MLSRKVSENVFVRWKKEFIQKHMNSFLSVIETMQEAYNSVLSSVFRNYELNSIQ